jgi:hypothetical protein
VNDLNQPLAELLNLEHIAGLEAGIDTRVATLYGLDAEPATR